MAERWSLLPALPGADVDGGDILGILDVSAGLNKIITESELSKRLRRYDPLNVRNFGAIGDGLTHLVTAADIAAHGVGSAYPWLGTYTVGVEEMDYIGIKECLLRIDADGIGDVVMPAGIYRINKTLTVLGNPGGGFRLAGMGGQSRGPNATRLVWTGALGGTLVKFTAANGYVLQYLGLDGTLNGDTTKSAKYVLHVVPQVTPIVIGSSGGILDRCVIEGFVGTGSAGVALGATGVEANYQASEVTFLETVVQGSYYTSTAYSDKGVACLTGGNTKNFRMFGGTIGHCDTGFDYYPGSGILGLHSVAFTNNRKEDVRQGGGALAMVACETESGGMFLNQQGGGASQSSATLINCTAHVNPRADRYTAEDEYINPDVIIRANGALKIIGGFYENERIAGAIPNIQAQGSLPGSRGSFSSEGACYSELRAGVDGSYVPVIQQSGAVLLSDVATDYGTQFQIRVSSQFDYSAAGVIAKNVRGYDGEIQFGGAVVPSKPFASLPAAANGVIYYVPDGTPSTNPLTGGGTGALAIRQNNAWRGL